MKYKYCIGGITIASDIYYPEMVQTNNANIDVVLAYGHVPECLENNEVNFPFVEANERQYLLKLPGIARYLVENGSTITMQAVEGALPDDVRKQVLTVIFGVLSYQRGFIPMHGGVVIYKGKTVLISGISAMGKSALLATLYKQGGRILSDDISNIKIVDNKIIVYPGFPRLMLWKDTMRQLGLKADDDTKLRTDLKKYLFPVDDAFENNEIVLNKVCILTTNTDGAETAVAKGMNKVTFLRSNLFHPWMINIFCDPKEYAAQMLSFSGLTEVFLLSNDQSKSIEDIADLLIEKITDAE